MQIEGLMDWLEETHRVWRALQIIRDVIKAVQLIHDFIHWVWPSAFIKGFAHRTQTTPAGPAPAKTAAAAAPSPAAAAVPATTPAVAAPAAAAPATTAAAPAITAAPAALYCSLTIDV